MATIDPNIALGGRPLQIENPLTQYSQMQNILAAQSQNKLAEANLKQVDLAMKEAEEAKTAIAQIMAAAKKNNAPTDDPMDAGMQMLQHPSPKVQAVGQQLIESVQKVQAYQQDKAFRNYGKPQPQTTFTPGALGSGTFDPNAPNQLAPAPAAAPVANALSAPSRADQLFDEIVTLQTQFPNSAAAKNRVALLTKQWEEASKAYNVAPGGSLVVGGKEVYKATEKTPPPPAMVAEYEFAKTPAGGNFKGSYQQFVTARAAASRAPAQPTAPVAVIDPISKQAVYVSREEALRNKMQPASNAPALKPLTEGQEIKLRTDVSKDYKAATTTLAQMDDLLDSIEAVKTAPGLAAATGYTGKYLPSFSEGKAAQAETRIANLRGKVTALGKATAAMSGSIGSIANQEWKILADQIAALDEVKGAGPLLEQIALVEQQALGASARIRDVYEKTRAEDFERFPQFRDLPANRPRGKPADAPANAVTNPKFPGFSIGKP